MKNIILAIAMVLTVTACTQKSDNKTENSNEQVVVLEAKSGIITGAADFGIFEVGATSTKLISFILKNDGTEPLTGPASLDNSTQGFSISYSNCPASLAKTRSCSIKVVFDPRSLSAGAKSANLMFDSVFVNLTATINAPVAVPSVDFLVSSVVVNSLNFGQITDKQSILKSITIKNTGTGPITDTVVVPVGYTLSYDACSGKAIAKNSSCAIKVTLSGAGKSGIISGNLSYGGVSMGLTGEVLAAATFSNVVLMNGSSIISSYDFGSLSGTANSQLILNIKNTGTGSAALASASLTGTDFSIVYNQCTNISLAPNASCQVRVLFSAAGKAVSSYSSTLSFGNKSLALAAAVVVVPQTFTVSNIALASDSKSFTVTGTGLTSVNSAKILETNQTEIDTLVIEPQSRTATQLILKPSKNLTLPAGDVIMRIQ